jgi:hypothetical protein
MQDKLLVEIKLTDKEESLRVKHQESRTKPLANDLCHGGKLLFQLYFSKKRQLVLPNPSARPGSGQPDEICISGVCAYCALPAKCVQVLAR